MKELIKHDERAVAPSAGVDVVTVLAHALRADRLEFRAGCWVALLWVLFWLVDTWGSFEWMTEWSLAKAYGECTKENLHLPGWVVEVLNFMGTELPVGGAEPSTGYWVANYAIVSSLQWLVQHFPGHGTGMYSTVGLAPGRRTSIVRSLLTPGLLLIVYWAIALAAVWNNSENWVAVVFPLLLSVPVWAHRRAVEAVLRDRLSNEAFEQQPGEEVTGPAWLRSIGWAIDREQYSGIILYDPDQPFVGLGRAVDPWSVVMDLERRPGTDPVPLTAAEVLDGVKRKLADLARIPASAASQDRLRDIEIDQVVYLPAGPPREEVDHREAAVVAHLAASVGEGGGARRHFLRVRVGVWDHMVVSVLVRVHTQGEALALEAFPHVLGPLKPEFGLLDDIVGWERAYPVSSVARAFLTAPTAGVAAVFSIVGSAGRTAIGVKQRLGRRRTGGTVPSKGATQSVREIASRQNISLLQAMDASRYLETIQERIRTGVLQVLKGKGYETGRLEQQVVQVSNGGIYITSMTGGAVAAGQGARARGIINQSRRTLRRMPTTSRSNR